MMRCERTALCRVSSVHFWVNGLPSFRISAASWNGETKIDEFNKTDRTRFGADVTE
jgi:hypothetical protein